MELPSCRTAHTKERVLHAVCAVKGHWEEHGSRDLVAVVQHGIRQPRTEGNPTSDRCSSSSQWIRSSVSRLHSRTNHEHRIAKARGPLVRACHHGVDRRGQYCAYHSYCTDVSTSTRLAHCDGIVSRTSPSVRVCDQEIIDILRKEDAKKKKEC